MKYLLFTLAILFPVLGMNLHLPVLPDRVIKGKVVDAATGEPLIFANVIACNSTGTVTDLDGQFIITVPDSCNQLEFAYTGFTSQIQILNESDSLHVQMYSGITISEVTVVAYKVPLIERNCTTQGSIKTSRQIRNLPSKNINAIAATTAGLSSIDGGDINIRGSRKNATEYYVDGIRVQNGNQKGQKKRVAQNVKATRNPPNIQIPVADFNTEDYTHIVENAFQRPADAPLSTFSVDVDVASYANMRRHLSQGTMPPKDAIRIEELVNYFDYEYPQPGSTHPIAIYTEVGECPWATNHKLVHIGLQGLEIARKDLPPSNLVFLIDVSGSMDDPNKLPLVIESFKILTENLRNQDRVAIVVYAGAAGLVLPSTSGKEKQVIKDAISRLEAGGSTAGAAGIKLAYMEARKNFIEGGNNRVILATDGDFNVGVSSDSELISLIEKERESGVFLTTLGYGMGNYKDNKLEQLADHGNGNHGYVDNLDEAKKVFVHEFGGTLFTIAKDVKIQVEFNPALVEGYRLVGYENRLLADEDFNDDKKDAGEIGSGHTVTAIYEIIPAGVASEFLKNIDPLKYQATAKIQPDTFTHELMTVKFRYKDPDGNKSKLLHQVITDTSTGFQETSENFRWSAAVASFGMVLRNSDYRGTASMEDVEKWAITSASFDEYGYKDEFIALIGHAKRLMTGTTHEPMVEKE